MKTTLLIFSFALMSCSVVAQNWSPVNTTEAFNFRLDNDPVITSTIRSTSFAITATDTIFALNTVMCDSCITIIGGPVQGCDTCYGWKNKPQFFGREVVVTNSGWCHFRDPNNQVINLHASVNDSWLFDTSANVTATLTSSVFSSVMGNPDSVKTILLSTGDTIHFSKNYGIVQWPNGYGQNSYYRLVGIHGRNVGTLVPRMMDYFNFDIGDLFEFHGMNLFGFNPVRVVYVRKFEIMNKVISGDTVTYSVDSYEIDTNYTMQSSSYITLSGLQQFQLVFIDSADHFGNYFNNQLISQWNRAYDPFLWQTISNGWGNSIEYGDTCFYRCDLFLDSLNLNSIHFGSVPEHDVFWFPTYYSGSIIPYVVSDTLMAVGMNGETTTFTLTEGLGQTFSFWSQNFEHQWGEKLWAYRKGNDTVGVFSAQNLFDGISEHSRMLNINVFPNPSSGTFKVQLPANTIAEIEILDLQGRVVKTFSKQSGQISLQADDLADGIYLLRVTTPIGNGQQKIIISH